MTVEQAIRRYPEFTDAIRAIEAVLGSYLDHDREVIDSIEPIRPDHPDRVLEPYPLHGGGMSRRVEFTHLVRSRYSEKWGCLHGIDTERKAHLWAD